MIAELRALFEQAEQLPKDQQTYLAHALEDALDELAWDQSFQRPGSSAFLQRMKAESLAEHEAGQSEEIVGDDL